MVAPRWIPLVVLALALLAAAPASAGTASVSGGQFVYTAAPAGANRLDVNVDGAGAAQVTEASAVVITPGGGCSNPENDNTATCTGITQAYTVDLGDLNDSALMDGYPNLLGIATLHGGSGRDNLVDGPSDSDIFGDEGDDSMTGGAGQDFLRGGVGSDCARYDETPARGAPVTATLNTAADDGFSSEFDNVNFDGGVECLLGGPENDTFTGNSSSNSLFGGAGNDTLNGLEGDDGVDGGDGSDVVGGGANDDTLTDEDSTPVHDTYDGGGGSDELNYGNGHPAVRVDLADAGGDGSPGENDAITNVEGLRGTMQDDVLLGEGGAGTFDGNFGDDFIDGRGGADFMVDSFGTDTVSYASHSGAVTANLPDLRFSAPAADDGEAGEGDIVSGGFEVLEGGSGPDNLTGSSASDVIHGAGGDDVLLGNAGRDEIDGGDGNDQIVGDDGNDHLVGGPGADGIDGAEGDDSIRVRDGEQDVVRCLGGFDSVVGDPVDRLLQGCESFDDGQPPRPPDPPVTNDPPPDTRAAAVTLDKLPKTIKRAAFLKGVKLGIACDEACALAVELRGSPRQLRLSRNELVLGSRSLGLGTGKRRVTVKPSRKLVGRSKRFTVQVRVTATDGAGNRSAKNATLRVP